MLIYPDAKDIIDLVAHEKPVPAAELQRILEATNSRLVLSFENVSESIVADDASESRRRLRLLEQLPVRFMVALPGVRCRELAVAVEVFKADGIAAWPNPFISHWVETFGYPRSGVIGYSLSEAVMELLHKNPAIPKGKTRN